VSFLQAKKKRTIHYCVLCDEVVLNDGRRRVSHLPPVLCRQYMHDGCRQARSKAVEEATAVLEAEHAAHAAASSTTGPTTQVLVAIAAQEPLRTPLSSALDAVYAFTRYGQVAIRTPALVMLAEAAAILAEKLRLEKLHASSGMPEAQSSISGGVTMTSLDRLQQALPGERRRPRRTARRQGRRSPRRRTHTARCPLRSARRPRGWQPSWKRNSQKYSRRSCRTWINCRSRRGQGCRFR